MRILHICWFILYLYASPYLHAFMRRCVHSMFSFLFLVARSFQIYAIYSRLTGWQAGRQTDRKDNTAQQQTPRQASSSSSSSSHTTNTNPRWLIYLIPLCGIYEAIFEPTRETHIIHATPPLRCRRCAQTQMTGARSCAPWIRQRPRRNKLQKVPMCLTC